MLIKPLARSRADQRRFVDRKSESDEILRAVGAAQPVLLLGERGSGRTSLLNRVAWLIGRAPQPRDAVLLNGELAGDPAQLFGVLVARLGHLAEPHGPRARWIDELHALSMPDGPFGEVVRPAILMELVDLLGERLAELTRPVCVMIDEIAPAVAHGVFGTLRNELWALEGVSWVIAGERAARALYLEPPADAFFERVVDLPPLSDADAVKLLRAHVPDLAGTDLDRALGIGAGNPRRLLRAAADLAAGLSPENPHGQELVARAAAVGGELAGSLIEYVAEHGPTAASDATMLRQTGMSRQRASQLLHTLESAGLLETVASADPGRRGRPPRRFAVRSDA